MPKSSSFENRIPGADYNQGMDPLIDEIKFSRRRTLAIEVQPGGKVIMRAPLGTKESKMRAFVREKADWIRKAKTRMERYQSKVPFYQFVQGEQLLFLGKNYPLALLPKVKGGLEFSKENGFVLQSDRKEDASRLLTKFYREETRKLTSFFAEQYAKKWGLTYKAIRITGAKKRWGSCSGKNNLNFSYRLAMLPIEVLEYVLVHELAHTRHHDHSKAFWEFVTQMLPEAQTRRGWLKQNARSLPDF